MSVVINGFTSKQGLEKVPKHPVYLRAQVLSSVDEQMEGREEQQQEPLLSLLPYLYFHFIDSTHLKIIYNFIMKKAGTATSASSSVSILFVPLSYITVL
jgi:hypothetical protein